MSAEKRVPPRSFSILQRNSGIVRSCTPFRREHSYLSAADATQEALCQRWNSIWPHESEDLRVIQYQSSSSLLSFVRAIPKQQYQPSDSLGRDWNTVPLDATTQQFTEHTNLLGFAATT